MIAFLKIIGAFIQQFLDKYLSGFDPAQNESVAQYVALAASEVIAIVEAAAADSALEEGAQHNKAVSLLMGEMAKHSLPLDPAFEKSVAELVVATAEAEVRKRGGSFFGNLTSTLNAKLNSPLPASLTP